MHLKHFCLCKPLQSNGYVKLQPCVTDRLQKSFHTFKCTVKLKYGQKLCLDIWTVKIKVTLTLAPYPSTSNSTHPGKKCLLITVPQPIVAVAECNEGGGLGLSCTANPTRIHKVLLHLKKKFYFSFYPTSLDCTATCRCKRICERHGISLACGANSAVKVSYTVPLKLLLTPCFLRENHCFFWCLCPHWGNCTHFSDRKTKRQGCNILWQVNVTAFVNILFLIPFLREIWGKSLMWWHSLQ